MDGFNVSRIRKCRRRRRGLRRRRIARVRHMFEGTEMDQNGQIITFAMFSG